MTLKGFFEGVRDGRLMGIRCGKCGEMAIPPKEFCPCGARDWQGVSLSGEGTIASFTVIRIAPTKHAGDAPYAVGAVKLAEGASLFGRIVDIPFERLAIGLPVRFRTLTIRDQALIGFGPA